MKNMVYLPNYRTGLYGFTLALSVFVAQAQGLGQNVIPTNAARPVQTFELDKSNAMYQVVERGANHRVWQKAETIEHEDGSQEEVIHAYTELGSGLHYWDEDAGAWGDSRAVIEPYQGGAVAQFGQQKVIFSNNLNTLGSIHILAPDGVNLKASVLGLGYFDSLSGKSVILAELKNSIGEQVGDDQILYRDAFRGVSADILYTYTLTSLEQDVILRENPPPPSDFGLPNLTSRLEVMTEWFDVPKPQISSSVMGRKVTDSDLRAQMAEPDLVDEDISFGELRIGRGRAFWQNRKEADPGHFQAPVGKKWEVLEGRTFLFESIEYESIEAELKKLPKTRKKTARLVPSLSKTFVSLQSPRRSLPETDFMEPSEEMIQLSELGMPQTPGFVLDYFTYSGTLMDFTFYGDQTYYLSSTCVFNGTTTFYGGAVIKWANGTGISGWFQGGMDFKTSLFSPVIVTAKDDNSVGDTISGSSGSPYGSYSWSPFRLNWNAPAVVMKNVIIRYAARSILAENGEANVLRHAALLAGGIGAWAEDSSSISLENVLIDDFNDAAVYSDGTSSITGSHLSIHDTNKLQETGTTLSLENSLIVALNTISNYTNRGQAHNVELANYADAFQTMGAGEFYLKSSSPYRDFGSAATIDAGLHEDLKERTTHPPGAFYNYGGTGSNLTWTPTVARDTDTLDLGYHYPPIDVAVYHYTVYGTGTVLTIDPGTVVAIAGYHGLRPYPNTTVTISGQPFEPAVIAQYRALQEQTTSWVSSGASSRFISPYTTTTSCANGADLNISYGILSGMAGAVESIYCYSSYPFHDIEIKHSKFYGTDVYIYENCGTQTYRNNHFRQTYLSLNGSNTSVFFKNNTLLKGTWSANYWMAGPQHIVSDNVFDQTYIIGSTNQGITHYYNGYIDTPYPYTFPNSGPTDVSLTGGYAWQSGPMGHYYHPTGSPFIDVGSQTGSQAGLHHHTTLVAQSPEQGGVVDMGCHYAALDPSGNLLDTDNDQIPNVLEDVNGNGVHDPGETDWGGGSGGGGLGAPDLEVFTILQ